MPNKYPLYCLSSNAVITENKLYNYQLPSYAIFENNSLIQLSMEGCQALPFNAKLCCKRLSTRNNSCLQNQFTCDVVIKDCTKSISIIAIFGHLIASKATCSIEHLVSRQVLISKPNGVYYVEFNFTGAVVCSDGLSLPSELRSIEYTELYSEPYTPQLPHPLSSYTVEDWTDYKTLKEIETGLAAQVVSRYISFSRENDQWIWVILTFAEVILYASAISIGINCWCKMCKKIILGTARTNSNAVRYTPSAEDDSGATSILRVIQIAIVPTQITSSSSSNEQSRRLRSVDQIKGVFRANKTTEMEGGLNY